MIPAESTFVYVMTHPAYDAGKVGLGASGRMDRHTNHGWELYRGLLLPSRDMAVRVEAAVLAELRTQGLTGAVPAELMPQSGHTETVDLALVPAAELWRRVEMEASLLEALPSTRPVVLHLGRKTNVVLAGLDIPVKDARHTLDSAQVRRLVGRGWKVWAASLLPEKAHVVLDAVDAWASGREEVQDYTQEILENPDRHRTFRHAWVLPEGGKSKRLFAEARRAAGIELTKLVAR